MRDACGILVAIAKGVSVCPIFAFIIRSIQVNLMNLGEKEGYKESSQESKKAVKKARKQLEQGVTYKTNVDSARLPTRFSFKNFYYLVLWN